MLIPKVKLNSSLECEFGPFKNLMASTMACATDPEIQDSTFWKILITGKEKIKHRNKEKT